LLHLLLLQEALQRLRRAAKDLRPEVSLKGKDSEGFGICYLTSGEVGGFSPKLKDIFRKKKRLVI